MTVISSGTARQPRGQVKLNGTAVAGWVSWTVTNNSFYEADTFSVIFAASALNQLNNAAWFSNETETFVEIFGSPDNSPLQSFIYGRIDDIDFDPVGQTICITGRDLTGAFIDAKVSADYTNQTASQIAITLASSHGLTSNGVTKTKSKAGSYKGIDATELQLGSEWDVLAKLARQEGFVCIVVGKDLYFGPDQTGTGYDLNINYQVAPASGGYPVANVISIGFSRAQTVVKGIVVTVMSAGTAGQTVKKSYPTATRGTTPGKSSPYGAQTLYSYVMEHNATPQQVQQRAETLYNQIISHAMKMRACLPADINTSPTSTIKVKGTGTAFDQTYYPRVVTRSMSTDGFVMDIDAQSYSPNLTPANPSL